MSSVTCNEVTWGVPVKGGSLVIPASAAHRALVLGGARELVRGSIPGVVHPSPCVTVPSPPLLDPADSVDRHTLLVAHTYEGAVRASYGVVPWVFRAQRCAPVASKQAPLLRATSTWCLGANIAPAVWCVFALGVWRYTDAGKSGKAPAVNFILSSKLQEKCKNHATHVNYALGGARIRGPCAAEFFDRQCRYIARLRSHNSTPVEAMRAVWGSYDAWKTLLQTAEEECRYLTGSLAQYIDSGGWAWHDGFAPVVRGDVVKWR